MWKAVEPLPSCFTQFGKEYRIRFVSRYSVTIDVSRIDKPIIYGDTQGNRSNLIKFALMGFEILSKPFLAWRRGVGPASGTQHGKERHRRKVSDPALKYACRSAHVDDDCRLIMQN